MHLRESFLDREFTGIAEAAAFDDPADAPGARPHLKALHIFASPLLADALEKQRFQFMGCLLRLGHGALRGPWAAMVHASLSAGNPRRRPVMHGASSPVV